MLKQTLTCMLEELSNYHNDKDKILSEAIQDRLSKSIQIYYQELTNSINFLNNKNELQLMKRLNKR